MFCPIFFLSLDFHFFGKDPFSYHSDGDVSFLGKDLSSYHRNGDVYSTLGKCSSPSLFFWFFLFCKVDFVRFLLFPVSKARAQR